MQLSAARRPGENCSSYACKCENYIKGKKPIILPSSGSAVVLVLHSYQQLRLRLENSLGNMGCCFTLQKHTSAA